MLALFAALLLVPVALQPDATGTASGPAPNTGGPEVSAVAAPATPLSSARAYVDSLETALDAPGDGAESSAPAVLIGRLRTELEAAQDEVSGLRRDSASLARRVDAEGGTDWLPLAAGGALGLLLGLGAGWVVGGRRQRGKGASSGGTRSSPYRITTAFPASPDRTEETRATPVAPDADLEATIQNLERAVMSRLDQIERKIASVSPPTPARPDPRNSRSQPSKQKAPPRADGQGSRVGAAFASWCREAGPAVSERAGFAARLAEAVPGATVRPVYRDRDSARLPVVFADDEGRSPAEYWTVEGAGGPWLLPFPQGPRQFRDLADGTFDGGAVAPRSLQSATPARLQPAEGGGYAVAEPGRLA